MRLFFRNSALFYKKVHFAARPGAGSDGRFLGSGLHRLRALGSRARSPSPAPSTGKVASHRSSACGPEAAPPSPHAPEDAPPSGDPVPNSRTGCSGRTPGRSVPGIRPPRRAPDLRPQLRRPHPLVGHEVMARLADGRKMVQILRRGAAHGLSTLESINTRFKPIEDVELLWALPFMGLRASCVEPAQARAAPQTAPPFASDRRRSAGRLRPQGCLALHR